MKIRIYLRIAIMALLSVAAVSPNVYAETWDMSADWSLASNPNGAWSYGRKWTLDGNFILFDCTHAGWFWLPCGSWHPSMYAGIGVWPNDNSYGYPSIRWTCPEPGLYDVNCIFEGIDSRGVDVFVYVLVNDEVRFTDHIEAYGDSTAFSLDRCPLAAGEYVDFLVAWAGGINPNDSCWTRVTGTIGSSHLVQPDGTGDFATIQDAINAASSGDVIELADGVFTGDGNRDIDFLGKGVTVRSLNSDPEHCIIDCQGTAVEPHRGFVFQSGEGLSARLEEVTVVNGWADDGGAITITDGSSPTIVGCILRENFANYGGAIYCYGSPLIQGCTIVDNVAGNRGGGVYAGDGSGADTVIEDCLIANNSAADGGGVHCRGTVTIASCTITGNSATWSYAYGGGVSCRYHSGTISNCTLVGNWASSAGSIAFYGDGPLVQNCIIAGSLDGGALGWGYGGPNSTPSIACCDIWGNQGSYGDELQPEMIDGGGNFSANPQFCGLSQPDRPYSLAETSPCAPDNNPGCGLIGAFDVECSGAIGVDEQPVISAKPRILGSYPNPFNPRTTVSFTLPEAGQVQVAIYDARGMEVARLVDETLAAGLHTVDWDGRDAYGASMPSGTYFCRLTTSWGVETRKLQLVR